jgi:hypothetical protein
MADLLFIGQMMAWLVIYLIGRDTRLDGGKITPLAVRLITIPVNPDTE